MKPLLPLLAIALSVAVPVLPPDDEGDEVLDVQVQDLDGDGTVEALRTLVSPGSEGATRVELWRAQPGGVVRLFAAGPAPGLAGAFEGGALVVRLRARGARDAVETRRYVMRGGALAEDSVASAAPVTTADQLAWGLEWSRRKDRAQARWALRLALRGLEGSARGRAVIALARIELLYEAPEAAMKLLATLSDGQGGVFASEAARMKDWCAAWVPRSGREPAPVVMLVAAQLDLEAGRLDEAGERARRALALSPAGAPWIDEALLVEARAHLESGRTDRAAAALVELVERCPASPHRPLALTWAASLPTPRAAPARLETHGASAELPAPVRAGPYTR